MRWLCALVVLLAGCSGVLSLVPRRVDLATPTVQLPLRFLHDVPLVQASIDGGPRGWFLLDLGASGAILSDRVARNLHAPRRRGLVDIRDAAGKLSSVERSVVRVELRAGAATFVDTNAIVVDLEPFTDATGVAIDGILGWSLFARVLLTIDYAGARATLAHAALPRSNELLALHEVSAVPAVDVEIGGVERTVMIDTGAMCAFALPSSWARTLPTREPWRAGRSSRNLFGTTRSPVAHLASELHLGRYVLPGPIIEQSTSDMARMGSLVLRSFVLTFDAAHHVVRFHHEGEDRVELQPWNSIGVGLEKRGGAWTVVDVIPDHATLGVELGDRVVALAGAPVDGFTIEDWGRVIDRGLALELTLERKGTRIDRTLPVFALP